MATNGSDLHSDTEESNSAKIKVIDDKCMVEYLKAHLRRCGDRVSGKRLI